MTTALRPVDCRQSRDHSADSMSRLSAEELLAAVADGRAEAFDELYARFVGTVRRGARAVLRDPSHADEVTQEVFLHIWRHAADFQPGRGSVAGWVNMLTHSRAVDRVRATSASRRRDQVDAGNTFNRDHDSVAEQVLLRHEHEHIRAGLATLTQLQRESIEMMYFGQLNPAQIGAQLSVPAATVKTRIRDGLLRLRALVADQQSFA